MHTMTAPANLAELTADFFTRAGEDPELSERMAFANTTVHIHFTDESEETGCTVWLDKSPISAEAGLIGEPEIELHATSEVYMDLFSGRKQMAIAIVHGEVAYRGPVRKFLRIVPILSSFDFDMFQNLAEDPESTSPDGDVSGPTA